jgi:hypothetical protein
MKSIYEENSLGGVTLKPNCEVSITDAHDDLIGEMHNFEFGKLLKSVDKMRKALMNAGYTKIISSDTGWTELK